METKLYLASYKHAHGLGVQVIEATSMQEAYELAEKAWGNLSIEEIIKTGENKILIQE